MGSFVIGWIKNQFVFQLTKMKDFTLYQTDLGTSEIFMAKEQLRN